MQHLTRSDALDLGLLLDVTDIACEAGYEMTVLASAEVVRAHGVAGLRAIVIVISQMPELCDGPAPIRVDIHDGGAPLNVAREPDGAVIVAMADGPA